MRRAFITLLATAVLLAVAASAATAAIVELGQTATALVAPPPCSTSHTRSHSTTCPGNVSPGSYAIVLTRVTALPALSNGIGYPTTVTTAGRLVAFTVGVSSLDTNRIVAKSEIHYFNTTYGGHPKVELTVLKPVGPSKLHGWMVVAESPVFDVQPYLGQVVQFPLDTTIPVQPGDVVALTTPTWAPVLQINLIDTQFGYRQSRATSCGTPPATSAAQLSVGQRARYGCDYSPDRSCPASQHHRCGTRVEMSATEVTNPQPVNPIDARDRGRW
jgi:hypothetical protein